MATPTMMFRTQSIFTAARPCHRGVQWGRVVRRSSAGRRHPEESAAPPAPGPRRHRLMEPGSVRSVVERLTSWCTLHERGLARVEWDSMYAPQEVVNRLRFVLGGSGIPV